MTTRNPTQPKGRVSFAILFLLLCLGGCRDKEITVYQLPKESAAAPAGTAVVSSSMSPAAAATAPAPGAMTMPVSAAAPASSLLWTAAPGWLEKTGNAMRRGSYTVGAEGNVADLSITAFPGDVGGVLPNINRWRGQIALPPIDEAGLPAATTAFDANALHFILMDATATAPGNSSRILAAMVPWQGSIWFFKLTGTDAAVAAAKPAFLDFLKTVRAP